MGNIRIGESGEVFYLGTEIDLRCENIVNLIKQGMLEEALAEEAADARMSKINQILSED